MPLAMDILLDYEDRLSSMACAGMLHSEEELKSIGLRRGLGHP